MRNAIALSAGIAFSACGGGPEQVPQPPEAAAPASGTAIDLAGHGFPLAIALDPPAQPADSPAVRWNEETGQLSIRTGDRFGILITEEPGDIARLKADLDRDMLRTSTIIEEQPDRLVWRSAFPGEDLVFVHFYRVIQAEGRTFVVQDDDHGRFSEADIRRMVQAVRAKEPA